VETRRRGTTGRLSSSGLCRGRRLGHALAHYLPNRGAAAEIFTSPSVYQLLPLDIRQSVLALRTPVTRNIPGCPPLVLFGGTAQSISERPSMCPRE
jgi:hypothetical protein